ncbi:unnamed protein product, partial [marine sediment metagenome]
MLERNIYPGIVPPLLVLIGFFYGLFSKRVGKPTPTTRRGSRGGLATIIFYAVVLVISFVLALGPSLTRVFPLYKLCYEYVPYYNFSRTPGRTMTFAFLSISILAAFGAKC